MPQGKIKKGFFFYFGLFVLVLVAVFLVCLVIMMFNPGKNLLWMQYFTSNSHFLIEQTTDETPQKIDWSQVTELNITTDYAKVVVENNSDPERQGNGVYILNKAKGFAVTKNVEKFSYQVTCTGTRVDIEVICPKGFLYFSKNVEIAVHTSERAVGNKLRKDLTLNIQTVDGDVDIGGPSTKAATAAELGQLTVNCKGKGNVHFSHDFNSLALKKLDVTTNTGDISANQTFLIGEQQVKGLQIGCDGSFSTMNGQISFENLVADGKNVTISNQKGNTRIENSFAEKMIFKDCVQGNYVLNKISADVDFQYSEDTLVAPNFVFGDISGNFDFSAIGLGAKPNIEINSVLGNLNVECHNGALSVGKAFGLVNVHSDGTFNASVTLAENNNNVIYFDVQSGAVVVKFLKNVSSSGVTVTTDSASVTFLITQNAKFVATLQNQAGTVPLDDLKVSVNLGSTQKTLQDGVLSVNQSLNQAGTTNGNISVKTNSAVKFDVV